MTGKFFQESQLQNALRLNRPPPRIQPRDFTDRISLCLGIQFFVNQSCHNRLLTVCLFRQA